MRTEPRLFTLIEVVVAIAILALGLMSAFMMISSARSSALRALNKWEEQHMLAQAAEYYLLVGPKGKLDREFFPYNNYSATLDVHEPEGMPDGFDFQLEGWKLMAFDIAIHDANREVVSRVVVEKIVKEAALK